MAKQISLTFKDSDRERDLYEWLQEKVSKGAFIKEHLFVIMDNEKKGALTTFSNQQNNVKTSDNKKQRGLNTLSDF